MKNLLVLVLSLSMTLLFVEGIFRLLELSGTIPSGGFSQEEQKDYMKIHTAKRVRSPNPLLVFELDKNDPRVSSAGIRDREFSRNKIPGKLRIAAIGDSVTFGLGVPTEKTFPKLIERKLNDSGMNVEVINFGISAYDTIAELELYKTLASQFDPDIVILTYILNDPMRPGVPIDKILPVTDTHAAKTLSTRFFFATTRALDYLSTFSHFFKWIDGLSDKIVTGIISEGTYHGIYQDKHLWDQTSEAIRGFAEESRKKNDKLIVVAFPLLIDFTNYIYNTEHQQVIREFSRAGVPVHDMLSTLADENPEKFRLNNEDHTHPNEYGHQYIADSIIEFLRNTDNLNTYPTTTHEIQP